jgi:aspartyl protease family protein
MSTFSVPVTLIHPEHRDRTAEVRMLVDTGATYSLLPPDLVARLGLVTPYERRAVQANGQRIIYRLGEVRLRLNDEERTTVFFEGSPESRPLLGAFALEAFGLAADPLHGRLIDAPPALL